MLERSGLFVSRATGERSTDFYYVSEYIYHQQILCNAPRFITRKFCRANSHLRKRSRNINETNNEGGIYLSTASVSRDETLFFPLSGNNTNPEPRCLSGNKAIVRERLRFQLDQQNRPASASAPRSVRFLRPNSPTDSLRFSRDLIKNTSPLEDAFAIHMEGKEKREKKRSDRTV